MIDNTKIKQNINPIKVFNYHFLIILVYLTKSQCFDKYINFVSSILDSKIYANTQMVGNKIEDKYQFSNKFNSPPKILLGVQGLFWQSFQNNENDFNLSIGELNEQSAKVIITTSNDSSLKFEQIKISTLFFISDEALIQMIKIDEQEIENMSSNGSSTKIKQKHKLFNHQLLKKPNSKRNISCFIIGFRQEFQTSPPQPDSLLSFFVESIGDFNENQFQLIITTLDEQNSLKWVNLNCIEYYQYDQYFQPNEFIQSIHHNKYSYSQIESSNSNLSDSPFFRFIYQEGDYEFANYEFYGFSGMDSLFNSKLYIYNHNRDETNKKNMGYFFHTPYNIRAATINFISFKMYNCLANCEDCIDKQTCQKCKLKFTITNDNSVCVPCKDNCLSCDSNLNCLICQEPYYNYKGICYLNQPKRTYCISKSNYSFN